MSTGDGIKYLADTAWTIAMVFAAVQAFGVFLALLAAFSDKK